ncbi:MAG: formyltransferase family protein [Candidatus Marinamargulisbacteria bacterium]
MSLKIQIIVDNESWIIPFAKKLNSSLCKHNYISSFINSVDLIEDGDILFLLGCHSILTHDILKKNKHNIVVHESDLPKGKGWSPMTWQILEGKSEIPITLFEAAEKVDAGDIYIKDKIELDGTELIKDWQSKLGNKTIELCKEFLFKFPNKLDPKPQDKINGNYYPRRTPQNSELDVNKSIADQFNLLRTVDNDKYPAFFKYKGCQYEIKITKK